jgi:hypothetical protein
MVDYILIKSSDFLQTSTDPKHMAFAAHKSNKAALQLFIVCSYDYNSTRQFETSDFVLHLILFSHLHIILYKNVTVFLNFTTLVEFVIFL